MGQVGNTFTVVVAESDADLIKIIAYALRPYSDDIQIARDGFEAQVALDEMSPALMVLDLNLPQLYDANLLENLRAQQQQSGLCVILTSSYAARDVMRQLPPASALVQKPYDLSKLRDAIDDQLARA